MSVEESSTNHCKEDTSTRVKFPCKQVHGPKLSHERKCRKIYHQHVILVVRSSPASGCRTNDRPTFYRGKNHTQKARLLQRVVQESQIVRSRHSERTFHYEFFRKLCSEQIDQISVVPSKIAGNLLKSLLEVCEVKTYKASGLSLLLI